MQKKQDFQKRQELQKQKEQKNRKKLKLRYQDVEKLQLRLKEETPQSGDYLYDYKLVDAQKEKEKLQPQEFRKKYKINFSDLPISQNTILGLQKRKFIKMTEIQRCTIPHLLAGRDLVGASKTGSGKTLSYIIPILERLYLQKWNPYDGLGAIIILPTRELATQVFEVYNSISENHILSVGLIIGGKNLKYEKDNIKGMNVLICTPGRLLQHMDETADFDCSNVQILVIDEADMILELGFQESLNQILFNLQNSKNKQTILFSATLSKSIHEISKFSLQNPEHVFLHDVRAAQNQNTDLKDIFEAPIKLNQFYMECLAEQKINILFSFLKSHKKNKICIFMSTCKQVRFIYESMRKMHLGPPVFELHGRQKQSKRMAIFFTFAEKKYAVLFTTNIAARGLDFPCVDWIIQFDCPEDQVTYMHRVGRTARYKSGGNSLLLALPSEMKFVERLKEKGQQIKKLSVNPDKQISFTNTLQSYLVENIQLKYLAQRAFVSYMRSVYLAQDKKVFDISKIDGKLLAESFGLIQAPVIIIKQKNNNNEDDEDVQEEDEEILEKKRKLEALKEKIQKLKQKQNNNDFNEMEEQNQEKKKLKDTKHKKLQGRVNNDILSKAFQKQIIGKDEKEEEFLKPKKSKKNLIIQDKEIENIIKKQEYHVSKNQLKKIKPDGHFGGKNIVYFDDDGQKYTSEDLRIQQYKLNEEIILKNNENLTQKYMLKLDENKELDRKNELQRRKEKRDKKKMKEIEKHLQQNQDSQQDLNQDEDQFTEQNEHYDEENDYDEDQENSQFDEEQDDYQQEENSCEEEIVQKKIKKRKHN